MSERRERPTASELVGDLVRTLRDLRRELRARDRSGSRGLDRLVRFTSEVTIPATILLLETNVRALKLLQRSLRLARDPDAAVQRGDQEVASVGRTVVARIDDALKEASAALDTAADEEVQELLSEARDLNRELEDRLESLPEASKEGAEVDVDAELASLKDEVDRNDGTN